MSTTNALGGLRHVIGQLTRARLMRHKTIPLGALEAELRAIERDVETLVEAANVVMPSPDVRATMHSMAASSVNLLSTPIGMYDRWIVDDPKSMAEVARWREELLQAQAVLTWLNNLPNPEVQDVATNPDQP